MAAYILRRILQMIPVLVLVTMITFGLAYVLPGDPALAILGDQQARNQQLYQQTRRDLGLDRPLPLQYLTWAGHVLQGNFGTSNHTQQPVAQLLRIRLGPTVQLAVMSMLFSLLLAIPAGVVSALRPNSKLDSAGTLAAIIGTSIPHFWLGLLLILLFGLRLRWLSPSGYVPPTQDLAMNLRLMILPTITLGSGLAAIVMRQTRSSMLEVLRQDYVTVARAKGLRERRVVIGHALRNALTPVATVLGLQLGGLVGGAVIVETIFSIPGVGSMAADSIFTRDLPVLQAVVLVLTVAVLCANLLTDLVYAWLDPRIHYQ